MKKPDRKSRLFPKLCFILLTAINSPAALSGEAYSLKSSKDFFSFFLGKTGLSLSLMSSPVAFKACKEAPVCPRIFQKSFSEPCLSRLSTVEAEAKSEALLSIKEQWLGECQGYADNPEVSIILKNQTDPPVSIIKNSEGRHEALWISQGGEMILTAHCPGSSKNYRDCHLLQLEIREHQTNKKPGFSIPY